MIGAKLAPPNFNNYQIRSKRSKTLSAGALFGAFSHYDVTDRVAAEAALRDSEERFRTLADNISTLCWMAEQDGHIFWFNSRWYAYTGTTPADCLS